MNANFTLQRRHCDVILVLVFLRTSVEVV